MILNEWEKIRTSHEMLWGTIDWQLVVTWRVLSSDNRTVNMWSYKCSEDEKQQFLEATKLPIEEFEQQLQDYIVATFE